MNFLSEQLKDGETGPSCNVCGAIMSREPMPKRIQRRRTKGWKMPENAVYVGRPNRARLQEEQVAMRKRVG